MMNSTLILAIGLVLVHFLWQGLVIGVLFAAGRRVFRARSAAARYNWAVICLVLLCLAPLLTLAWLMQSGTSSTTAVGMAVLSESFQASAAGMAAARPEWTLARFLPGIVALWLAGVALMSLRLMTGWWYVDQLRRNADRALPTGMRDQLDRLSARLGLYRHVDLAISDRIAGPMLIGVFRPLILFPVGLLNSLSVRQVEMVLAHELAHLHRADHLVNLFQNVVETLLFYHPVVRWVSGEIRAERELVSDEQAARLTGDRLAYAETLLQLEKNRGDRPLLAIGMADHQVLTRVRHLLAPGARQSGSVISGMAVFAVLLVSVLTALLSTGLQSLTGRDSSASPDFLPELPIIESPAQATASPGSAIELPGSSPARTAPVSLPERYSERLAALQPEIDIDWSGPASVEAVLANRVLPMAGFGAEQALPQPPALELLNDVDQATEAGQQRLTASLHGPEPLAELRGGSRLDSVMPSFPVRAARRGKGGHAELRLRVNREGRVVEALVIEESPPGLGFGEAALEAVQQWRFEPFTRNGRPVGHEIITGFEFTDPPACERSTGTRIWRC